MRAPRPAMVVLLLLPACGGPDEPHPCDDGTPTCDSSLRVLLPDSRTDFRVGVEMLGGTLDGVVVEVTCPATAPTEVEGVTGWCGAGQATFETAFDFPDEVRVQLEELPPKTYAPDWQRGSDFCRNPCTLGSIQL